MFHIKLTARPDARMVEVPLDIEVELPREFDGAAVLVSSGMPRKVRLRSPRDSIKLSTAYRIDQLVADLVRLVLRGAQQDVARVQEGAAQFLKVSRERRQEGSTFLIESDGRGHIEVIDQPMQAAGPFRSSAFGSSSGLPVSGYGVSSPGISAGGGSGSGSASGVSAQALSALADRIANLESRLSALESKVAATPPPEPAEKLARAVGEQLERKLDQRLADLEEHVAALHRGEQLGRPLTRTSQALPTPGASRAGMRRATAVEAFADGLRSELKNRVKALLASAQERAAIAEKAAQVATEAERAGSPKLEAGAQLARINAEAQARASALTRIHDELEFYAASDMQIASQLVDRISRGEPRDPLPLVRAIVEESWREGTLQFGWLHRAAQLEGWKVIAPAPGDPFEPALHELVGARGDVVGELLMPGVHDKSGSMLLHARVRTRLETIGQDGEDELPLLEPNPGYGALPLIESSIPPPPEDQGDDLRRELASLAQAQPAPAGSDDMVSAQILEDLGSGPILSAPILSAEILGPITSGPILSGPIDSAPIISAPILSGPIPDDSGSAPLNAEQLSRPEVPWAQMVDPSSISARIEEELLPSAPILDDSSPSAPILDDASISAPILEEIVANHALEPQARAAAPEQSVDAILADATLSPPQPPADDEWDRIGQGPSAFKSSEGHPRGGGGSGS